MARARRLHGRRKGLAELPQGRRQAATPPRSRPDDVVEHDIGRHVVVGLAASHGGAAAEGSLQAAALEAVLLVEGLLRRVVGGNLLGRRHQRADADVLVGRQVVECSGRRYAPSQFGASRAAHRICRRARPKSRAFRGVRHENSSKEKPYSRIQGRIVVGVFGPSVCIGKQLTLFTASRYEFRAYWTNERGSYPTIHCRLLRRRDYSSNWYTQLLYALARNS